jgi:Leucine-rich repeat (LRR) protein
MSNTPRYIQRRIRRAEEEQLKELDLSHDFDTASDLKLTSIPDEVFRLKHLEVLNLSYNALSSIPAAISGLRNLKTLKLYSNQITIFPEAVRTLPNLTSLSLVMNKMAEIPDWISQLQNLNHLDLRYCGSPAHMERIAGLQRLTSLRLGGNKKVDDFWWISGMTTLERLDLSYCEFSSLPDWITRLPQLKSLSIPGNLFDTLPSSLTEIHKLAELYISDIKLKVLPEWLGGMLNLTHLDIGGNELSTVPTWLSNLQNLKLLSMNNCSLAECPEWLLRLQQLEDLSLVDTGLQTLPWGFSQLQNLRELNLSGNLLGGIPEPVLRLRNLEVLWMAQNQIERIPESIGQLSRLKRLSLANNQIDALPESISRLKDLTLLYLSNNRLTSIPDCLYDLTSLEALRLDNQSYAKRNKNRIQTLSPKILNLQNLKHLSLGDNPMVSPPPEVVAKGLDAIEDYFRQLETGGEDHLFEAKLLIVGEGGAGKTSLAKKIENPNYELREEEKSTEGIEVIQWSFPMEDGRQFRVNIWDFGGQEIYHATHQFFLTKRSLYVLMADNRKEDTDFNYWLSVVELLSDKSPLLIVKNEKQDRQREINERQLRGEFSNLKETLSTNLATNRGLPEIVSEIKHRIRNLPHIGSSLPRTWVRVREALENDPRNYIGLEEYLRVCEANGFTEHRDKLQLSGFLHDIGVCLHFQEDPLLSKTVILKPKWGTDAVYKVLDDERVRGNGGKFDQIDLSEIWKEPEYVNMQGELLQLMVNFKLCYKIPNSSFYIAPQLLTENQPHYDWDTAENLVMRYSYEFMPKGILTQFIVALHRLIAEQQYVWRSGVILEKDETRAEVIELYGRREIRIRITGKHKKELLAIVTHELDEIHASYKRLKHSKLIPCNCAGCKASQEPCFYRFEVLRRFLDNRQALIQCQNEFVMVDVRRLIDDVVDDGRGQRAEPSERVASPAREQVFISYSHEDREWLDKLLKTLKPLTRKREIKVWSDTNIEPGTRWKEEIAAALASAKVAVLLVSQNFLASDFIAEHELPPLLEAAAGKGLVILWVAVSFSTFEDTEIAAYQSTNDPKRPLDSLPSAELNRVLVDIYGRIKAAALSS